MELKMPSPEQAYWGLRAMKSVALADGVLDDSERHMMEAVQRIFGTTYSVEELAPITPDELARAFPDPQLRKQLVQGLIVMSLIDGKANSQETNLVEQFAQALEINAPEVKGLRHVLKGEILQLRLDLVRRFWLRDKVKEIWNTEGIRGLYTFMRGMLGVNEDTALAARYQALEHYPSGSLARAYWEYCCKNGFALPGKRVARQSKSCFTIARTSYPVMERLRRKRSRWPVSALVSSSATRGSSSSSSSCNFTWAFV